MNMKNSDLQALSLIESGEPWPKKIKIERSILNLEEEQQKLLQRLYYAVNKSSNKTQMLCNVNQKTLELQDGNCTNLITSTKPHAYFKLCVDVNLQHKMLGNIPFYEKCILENRSVIGDIRSELSEQNILVTNPESQALHAKEREKSVESGRIWSELATVNPVSNDIWAENLITRIEPLLKDAEIFQSNENGTGCYYVHEKLDALYQDLKPVAVCDSSNGKILPLCLQARSFMRRSKSDLGSLFYTDRNVNKDGNILSFPKQTRCLANNFRRNKDFQHLYKPYSRKCEGVINPKLVKCVAFELLLQDKREYNCSTANEKNDTSIFSQGTAFNIQLKESSQESSPQKRHIFSKTTVEDDNTISIDDNEKEKKARQHALYDNQILQDNNFPSSSVWDTNLSTAKKEDLTAHSRRLSTLSSIPNLFEKSSIKHSNCKMIATMVTCTQKKKRKGFNENHVFFLRKFKTLRFVLRANQTCIAKRFRNSINFVRERKYVPRYLGTCSRGVIDMRKYSNCEDVGKSHCSSIATKTHLSLFETYNKIPLGDDCEELDQIPFINKVIVNYKNKEKYSKGYVATPSRITWNGHDKPGYFLPKLFSAITNCNCWFEEKCKSNPSYTNSQVLKQNNSIAFPINGKVYSRNILSFTSVIFHDLYIAQKITVSVKAWHSKVALFGKRRRLNSCIFDKMKSVLQDEPVCRSQVPNSFKLLQIKTMEDTKAFLQIGFFLSSALGLELVVSVKQNADYVRETEDANVEKFYMSKKNQHQNLFLPYFKNKSTKIIDSEDGLMTFSCAMTQGHFEDVTEKHLSPEFKNKREFEMNQFGLVLKELNGFNDISEGNKNSLMHEQRNIIQEDSLELSCLDSILQEDSKNICENKENVTSSTCGTSLSYATVVNQNKNRQIVFKGTGRKCSGEQEVPSEDCSSRILDEEFFCPTPEEYFDSGCKQPLPWNPAFVSCTSMEERRYSLQGKRGNCFNDGIIRVQPLKTCHGPLRVGLSRKAKPKQLHPYLK